MPPLGLITGKIDFTSLYWNLTGDPGRTLVEAEAAGDVILKYGELVNSVINFLIIAVVIFIVIKQMNRLYVKNEVKEEKKVSRKCKFCLQEVHEKATRCPHCTSQLTSKS